MARGDLPAPPGWQARAARGAALCLLALCGCPARAESQPAGEPGPAPRPGAQPVASAAATPASAEAPPEQVATLAFVGDITLASTVGQLLARRHYGLPLTPPLPPDYPFNGLAPRLRAADLLVGNLECVASPLGAPAIQALPLRCSTPVLDALASAGFDVLSVANNHALDFGRDAFADSTRRIEAAGLAHIGSEAMNAQPQPVHVERVAGLRLGLLAYYHPPAAPYDDVQRALSLVDVLIVYNHWGREGQAEPMPQQRQLGHELIEAGVDLVVGTHAHVVQTIERYGEGLIAYGLGNFVFDAMPLKAGRDTGAMLEVRVARDGVRAYRLVTTRMGVDRSLTLVAEPPWQPAADAD